MSRMSKAAKTMLHVASSFIRHPVGTARALKMLSSSVEGLKYGLETPLTRPANEGLEHLTAPTNPLQAYVESHREGAGIWKWNHYFGIYQRHFGRFVGRDVHILEVGVYSGGSLPMWRQYFGSQCRVYGVDIEPACTVYKADGIEIFIGDQGDAAFWAKVREAVPRIDILIDDGGHLPGQQRVTLEEMLPHLRPGGVYLCEDIHGTTNEFSGYLQGLAGSLHAQYLSDPTPGASGPVCKPSLFQQAVGSIHLYPFAAVIEKREHPLAELACPRHGTQWQPFRI